MDRTTPADASHAFSSDPDYQRLCARHADACIRNAVLNLRPHLDLIRRRAFNLSYPVTVDPVTKERYFLPATFGGVTVADDSDALMEAKVARLFYPLDADLPGSKAAERGLKELVDRTAAASGLRVHAIFSESLREELLINVYQALDFLPHGVVLVVAFTAGCTFWYGAEHLAAAVLGCVVVAVAVVAGSGLAQIQGYPWQAINLAGIFMTLGVGMDDVFIMLSAWSRTADTVSLPERLAKVHLLCTPKEKALYLTFFFFAFSASRRPSCQSR